MKRYPGAVLTALLLSQTALADPPLGIAGDVTIQNDESNPVPVVIQGQTASEPVVITIRERDSDFDGFNILWSFDSWRQCVGDEPVCTSEQGAYYVPENKRLEIDYVSTRVRVYAGNLPDTIFTSVSADNNNTGNSWTHDLYFMNLIDPGLNIYRAGGPLSATVPSGWRLISRIQFSNFGASDAESSVTFSGRLVTISP